MHQDILLMIITGFVPTALVAIVTVILRKRLLLVLLLIIVVSSMTTLFIGRIFDPKIPIAQAVFSDFNQCIPRNNYGCHWGVFNDNPFNGNSNATVKVQPYPNKNGDCYAVLSFYLGMESTIRPYCGMFSGFAPKPIESRDISRYSGIRFDTWCKGSPPEECHIYIQISPHRLIYEYDGYHQFEFTTFAKNDEPTKVRAPFSEFVQPPERQGGKMPFTKDFQKAIYQISIIIQGEKGYTSQGEVMIDNIEFFK